MFLQPCKAFFPQLASRGRSSVREHVIPQLVRKACLESTTASSAGWRYCGNRRLQEARHRRPTGNHRERDVRGAGGSQRLPAPDRDVCLRLANLSLRLLGVHRHCAWMREGSGIDLIGELPPAVSREVDSRVLATWHISPSPRGSATISIYRSEETSTAWLRVAGESPDRLSRERHLARCGLEVYHLGCHPWGALHFW